MKKQALLYGVQEKLLFYSLASLDQHSDELTEEKVSIDELLNFAVKDLVFEFFAILYDFVSKDYVKEMYKKCSKIMEKHKY